MSSWLPTNDSGFDGFFLNFKTLIDANPTDYGLLGSGSVVLA